MPSETLTGATGLGAGPSSGCFGKIPGRGDFVRRDLDSDFVTLWDDWLQRALAASRTALGGRWLDLYLTSPIWYFVLGRGVVGGEARAGVMVPSVDRVGRCYPLMVAAHLAPPSATEESESARGLDSWFSAATDLILDVVSADGPAETFFEGVRALGRPRLRDTSAGFYLSAGDATAPDVLAALATDSRASVWWSDGSEVVEPSTLVCPTGLPKPKGFTGFIDGAWTYHGWTSEAKATASPADVNGDGDAAGEAS